MRVTKIIFSLILAMVMIITSLNLVSAKTQGNYVSEAGSNHSGSTTSNVGNTSNEYYTGYKLNLVFLPIPALKDGMSAEEREEEITNAWDAATPNDALQIGKTPKKIRVH